MTWTAACAPAREESHAAARAHLPAIIAPTFGPSRRKTMPITVTLASVPPIRRWLVRMPELHKAGAAKVYREKISGAAGRRPQLEKLLRLISEGDVVLVTRLDRLARSTRDLLNILDKIGKAGP